MRLNISLGPYHYAAAAGFESVFNTVVAIYGASCRKVRRGNILHQLGNSQLGIVDKRYRSIDRLAEVVRRHIGSHTYRYTRGSVYKKIRYTRGQYHRLHSGVIIVGLKVHRLLIDIAKHLFAYALKTHLGITHSRRAVTVDRTEVTVAVDQRIAQCPRLCHTHDSTVY